MRGKEIIVTGAAGYIGGELSERLRSGGVRVVRLARSPVEEGIVGWDLEGAEAPYGIGGAGDVVVHCAASMNAGNADVLWRANVVATRNVARWASEIGASHLILVSTGGVYPYKSGHRWREDDAVEPIGQYGHSKHLSEEVVKMYARNGGAPASVFRLFFPFDFEGRGGIGRVIASRIRGGQVLEINEGGRPTMNPVHVDDFVELLVRAIEVGAPEEGFAIYNAAGKEEVTFLKMCQFFEKRLSKRAKLDFSQRPQEDLLGDITKATERFEWNPKTYFNR